MASGELDRSLSRLEGGAHRTMGVVESGSSRALWDAEERGDLRRGEAEVVAKNEERALLGWQPSESGSSWSRSATDSASSRVTGPSVGKSWTVAPHRRAFRISS
jgi:hypothetical protein